MSKVKGSTTRLLNSLRSKRATDKYAAKFPQVVGAAESIDKGIPTLKRGVYRKPSPMLQARFTFAGTWVNPIIGMIWFGVSDMEAAVRKKRVRDSIAIRRTYWEGSAPAEYELHQLSLFGFDHEDDDDLYIVWSEHESKEPWFAWYAAQHEHRFENLNELIEYLIGKR